MFAAAFASFALLVVAWLVLPSPGPLDTVGHLDLGQPEPESLAA